MDAKSMNQHHGRHKDVPALLVMSLLTLIVGLSLPFMKINKLAFWEDTYSLFTSIKGMWSGGHYGLAILIFFFSIIFPFAKLLTLLVVWYRPMKSDQRDTVLHWLSMLGKWSMLDVFVIAILIVLTQSKGYVNAEAQAGLFVFAAAIILSMVVSLRIEHLAKKPLQSK